MIKMFLYPTCPFFSSLKARPIRRPRPKQGLRPKAKASSSFAKIGRLTLYQNKGRCLFKVRNLKPDGRNSGSSDFFWIKMIDFTALNSELNPANFIVEEDD